MTIQRRHRMIGVLASLALLAAACGDDDSSDADSAPAATDEAGATTSGDESEPASDDVPTIVVTTNILGDVVGEVVGDAAEVVTIMPVGTDPHDYQASAQDVDQMMNADVLIVNGGGLEEGLLDAIESAEESGVPTFEALSAVETIEFGEAGHDHSDEEHSDEEHSDEEHSDEEHSDEEHSDEEHSDEEKDEEHSDEEHSDEEHSDEEHSDEEHSDEEHSDEEKDEEHSDEEHSDEEHSDEEHAHDHSGDDPHFWLDPMRMAQAVDGMVVFLESEVTVADSAALADSASAYVTELETIDAESVTMFEAIPDENMVLVTNHDSLGYFADHYGFEVAGTVIPGGSTADAASAGELAELAEVIEQEQVPAIFADNTASDELAQALAEEVGEVEVVELYTGSLGEPGSDGETYLLMITTNAERVTGGLA